MWPSLETDPDTALSLWENTMDQQRATERRLEDARRQRDAQAFETLVWQLDELRYRADLLLANAVQAIRDSAPPELPLHVRRAVSAR